jgi:hypothetical protein
MDEKLALEVNPFEGDFGSPGDVTLSKKIVTLRKERECDHCGQMAKKGTRCRTQSEIFDGDLHRYTWCTDCTAALATSWDDDGDAWEARDRRNLSST